MKVSEFDYHLPEELIAKYPAVPRHSARLMVLNRKDRSVKHDTFINLPKYLKEGDLLVFNDTKVLPARLYGKKPTGGKVEVLLTDYLKEDLWKALVGGKKIREGLVIEVAPDFKVEVLEDLGEGRFLVKLLGENPPALLDKYGRIPIPPYLKREEEPLDREYYQTVFAKEKGAVAAPTASLHFSEELLKKLKEHGLEWTFVTLHVSYGTFKPVKAEEVEEHRVDPEFIRVPEEAVRKIKETKERGGRVVAVGTTVVRWRRSPTSLTRAGPTSTFIPALSLRWWTPSLPTFTSRALLCSFWCPPWKDFLMKAYKEAVKRRYRFYSYGDGMLIL